MSILIVYIVGCVVCLCLFGLIVYKVGELDLETLFCAVLSVFFSWVMVAIILMTFVSEYKDKPLWKKREKKLKKGKKSEESDAEREAREPMETK